MAEQTLSDVLSKETLKSVVWGESYSRRRTYFEQGRVKTLKESEGAKSRPVPGRRSGETAGELGRAGIEETPDRLPVRGQEQPRVRL